MTSAAPTRRSLVQGLGATFALMFGTAAANAQSRVTRFQPSRHPQDAGLDAIPGKHRTFIAAPHVDGAGSALLYAYNLYLGNKSDYSLSERDVAVVVCFRHSATAFGFNDV